jgi:putative transcriptional regulator
MHDSLSNTIADLRKKHNLTQEELAVRVGVTRQTIIAIEKGNYTPSLLLAYRVAKVFRLPIETIFHYEKTH